MISTNIFINLWLQTFGLCFDELGCFISFSYKILCKVGRVGKPYFSVHGLRFNSFPLYFLTSWIGVFVLKTQRCQFLLLYLITAPFPGLPPPCCCSRMLAGGGAAGLGQGALTCWCLVSSRVSQRLLSRHLGLWAPISGAVIAALMVACSPHCVGSDAQLA